MTKANKKFDVRKMTYLAIFSALVFVLQIMAIPVGGFFESSALPVAVIVIGAALFGIRGGAWLGFVFGIAVMILPGNTGLSHVWQQSGIQYFLYRWRCVHQGYYRRCVRRCALQAA